MMKQHNTEIPLHAHVDKMNECLPVERNVVCSININRIDQTFSTFTHSQHNNIVAIIIVLILFVLQIENMDRIQKVIRTLMLTLFVT